MGISESCFDGPSDKTSGKALIRKKGFSLQPEF
jgi:hypothetical protein